MSPSNNLPQSHTVLGIVKALNSTEKIWQRGFRVSADEGEENPGSEERRLGVPAFLRKVSPDWTAAGQEQWEQDGGEAGESVHRDNKLRNIYCTRSKCYFRVVALLSTVITEKQNLCSSS